MWIDGFHLDFLYYSPGRIKPNHCTLILFSSGHGSVFISQEQIDRIEPGGRMGVREADQGSIHCRNPAFS